MDVSNIVKGKNMCSACGFPPAIGHWTDSGGQTPHERLRIRFARVALLNDLLRPMGLGARDLGAQPGIQVFNGTGATKLCRTLEEVWDQVTVFTGKPFDPLEIG